MLGRYELLDQLGSGGMAAVFRARDGRLLRPVAVKVLYPHYAGDPDFLKRFHREAEFAAGLSSHPHVVTVYDVGQDGDLSYIVMELVEGPNLKDLIFAGAPLSVGRAFRIGSQAASALHFAHQHGLVHRDVKPHNILVAEDDWVKVADFGIARHAAVSRITRPGSVMGTADYLSPEQSRGLPATPASDVYALGVVLYEMLTGRLPFVADTAMAVALQHIHDDPPAPDLLNPAVGPAASGVVMRALHKDPLQRYSSAAELAAAMDAAAAGSAGGVSPVATGGGAGSATAFRPLAGDAPRTGVLSASPEQPGSRSRRLLAGAGVAAAGGILAALLLAGWLSPASGTTHRAHGTPTPQPATAAPTLARPVIAPPRAATPTPTPRATATVPSAPQPTGTTAATAQPSPSPQSSLAPPTDTSAPPAPLPTVQLPSLPGNGDGHGDHGKKDHKDHGQKGHGDNGNQAPNPPGDGGDG